MGSSLLAQHLAEDVAQELFEALRNHAETSMTEIMAGDVPGIEWFEATTMYIRFMILKHVSRNCLLINIRVDS